MASDLARHVGVLNEGASSAALRVVANPGPLRSFKPVLSVMSEGVLVSGKLAARWNEGAVHFERVLTDYRRQRTLGLQGEPLLPVSLDVGVESTATLRAVACLGAAVQRVGSMQFTLAVGPKPEIPAETRSALSQIAPSLGQAFSRRVSVHQASGDAEFDPP
ncbi:hypothetical protein ACLEPN_04855 [Myxococcus sp. 1LA]